MNIDEVLDAFADPAARGVVPEPTADASAARRLRDAIEPLAMHSVWSRATHERLTADFGMDFMGNYLLSRAALMGAPDPGVVASAFAVFEPGMVRGAYEAHRGILLDPAIGPEAVLAARMEATTASLSTVLADGGVTAADVKPIADELTAAVSAADGTGRPLFSGLAGRPWPEDPVSALWRACEQAREHRGDSHVAVCVSRGLTPVEMNVLTELWLGMPFGSYSASRAWTSEQLDAAADALGERGLMEGQTLSAAGSDFRNEIEAATDALEQPIVDALNDFDDVIGKLASWSNLCVEAGAFPDNPFKRAAG